MADGRRLRPLLRTTGMGTYLFERHTGDGAGHDATASLAADVANALRQVDWVETFALREEDVD